MTHSLKVAGIVIVVLLALCGSTASADELTAESYPATLTGAHDPEAAADTLNTTAGSLKCPDATYHGTLSSGLTAITVTPSFNGANDTCTALGLPAVVHANGCDYVFHIEGEAATAGTTDIVCPAGKEITVTAGQNTAGSLTTKCTIHIPPQSGINSVTYGNVGSGTTRELRITVDATNIKYTHTSGTGLGSCIGGGATQQTNGTYSGKMATTGETDGGAVHIGLFLSTPQNT